MQKKAINVVIDTNLWISFLISQKFNQIDILLKKKSIQLLFSEELFDEFISVLNRPKFSKYISVTDLTPIIAGIGKRADFVQVQSDVGICRDRNDNFLLSSAKMVKQIFC